MGKYIDMEASVKATLSAEVGNQKPSKEKESEDKKHE